MTATGLLQTILQAARGSNIFQTPFYGFRESMNTGNMNKLPGTKKEYPLLLVTPYRIVNIATTNSVAQNATIAFSICGFATEYYKADATPNPQHSQQDYQAQLLTSLTDVVKTVCEAQDVVRVDNVDFIDGIEMPNISEQVYCAVLICRAHIHLPKNITTMKGGGWQLISDPDLMPDPVQLLTDYQKGLIS